MAVRNTKTSQMRAQQRRTQKLEAAAPTGFSSVTRGQFRVASEEGLLVQGSQRVSGRLFVSGYEEVGGQLRVTGSFVVSGNADVTGPMDVRGPLTVRGSTTFVGPLEVEGSAAFIGPLRIEGKVDVTGPFTVSGAMDITGDLTITGKTTVTGDLDVTGRSKFTGDLTIEGNTEIKGDTKLTGDMEVTSGGEVRIGTIGLGPDHMGGAGAITSSSTLYLSAVQVISLLANASIDLTSADGVNIKGAGLSIAGLAAVAPGTSGYSPLVVHTGTGRVARSTGTIPSA